MSVAAAAAPAPPAPPASRPAGPPPDAAAALERGRHLYEVGKWQAARSAADEAVRIYPAYADAYLLRGLVTLEVLPAAEARADLEMALRLAPDSKEAHRFYGEVLANAGETAPAEEHVRKALEIDPGYGDAVYLYGRLLRGRGDVERAIEMFEKHARLEPSGSAHHVLGEIFLKKGDRERAARELEADLAIDPTCRESRLSLAAVAFSRGDLGKARDHYAQSLLYHPADAQALSGLGRAYLALDDPEMAVGALRSALDHSPDDVETGKALAQARRQLRLKLGWPLAILPTALAFGLLAYILVEWRRRGTHGVQRDHREQVEPRADDRT